jgi:hypothetical protein
MAARGGELTGPSFGEEREPVRERGERLRPGSIADVARAGLVLAPKSKIVYSTVHNSTVGVSAPKLSTIKYLELECESHVSKE